MPRERRKTSEYWGQTEVKEEKLGENYKHINKENLWKKGRNVTKKRSKKTNQEANKENPKTYELWSRTTRTDEI